MQNIIKTIKLFLIINIIIYTPSNAKMYKVGEQITNNQLEMNKNFILDLSEGIWTVINREEYKWGYFDFTVWGVAKIEDKEIVEFYEVIWGDMGSRLQSQIDPLIYSAQFKDPYDGCYERPEYYLVKVFKKGRTHNCMVIRHWDVVKQIHSPDDPNSKWTTVQYRKFLRESNLDYAHGTGHGVGFFLNVHEGPQSINKINKVKIEPGMVLSNEPGYYKQNHFGIRIENLVYVDKEDGKLFFRNLTMAPIEKDLINFNLLTKSEKNYLFKYHMDVYIKISKYLNQNEKKWLANLI